MRKIHIVGLALAAVLAVSAFAASSAFALESTWLVAAAKPTTEVKTDSASTAAGFALTDAKGGIFGEEVEVLCTGTDEGTVGPGKADLLTKVTVTKCETMKGICGEANAEAINLPWTTSIELIGSAFYDDITTTVGSKEVGYNVICSKIVEDKCEVALARALLENGTGGTVNAIFNSSDANQPKANCSRGGTEAGLVNGTDVLLATGGEALAVSEG
jgi:hypothetical protein